MIPYTSNFQEFPICQILKLGLTADPTYNHQKHQYQDSKYNFLTNGTFDFLSSAIISAQFIPYFGL